MKINVNQIVSISEANRNFSRVARMTDKYGEIYIFKNNRPKYKLIDAQRDNTIEMSESERIEFVAERTLRLYGAAFRELARSVDGDALTDTGFGEVGEISSKTCLRIGECTGACEKYGISADDLIVLDTERVLILHEILSEETGGSEGVRDISMLESAISSAFATFGGKELYPTKREKAARICHSLISNHPFIDGNKRIGMYVLLVFLEVNGVRLRPTNDEVARVGLSVAAGEMDYDGILEWIANTNLKDTEN